MLNRTTNSCLQGNYLTLIIILNHFFVKYWLKFSSPVFKTISCYCSQIRLLSLIWENSKFSLVDHTFNKHFSNLGNNISQITRSPILVRWRAMHGFAVNCSLSENHSDKSFHVQKLLFYTYFLMCPHDFERTFKNVGWKPLLKQWKRWKPFK